MVWTLVCHHKPVSKRESMEWKYTDSSVKKKFQAQCSVKKVILTVFSDMKRPITIDFLVKGETVDSAVGKIPFIYWMTFI